MHFKSASDLRELEIVERRKIHAATAEDGYGDDEGDDDEGDDEDGDDDRFFSGSSSGECSSVSQLPSIFRGRFPSQYLANLARVWGARRTPVKKSEANQEKVAFGILASTYAEFHAELKNHFFWCRGF